MQIKATTALLALARGSALTLQDARGARVRVLAGRLWITQDRDRKDHFVDAGASFRIDRPGPTVVEATRAARFVVESPVAGALEAWWPPAARVGG
ncbi:MAG: DUF2917 domain-containing protein [Burkholderiales bacterium]